MFQYILNGGRLMMGFPLDQKAETLVDTAYRSIRKDIIEEVLPAGVKINFTQLSERYGVSPTPIKQAVNRLMAEGLIETVPHKGSIVRKMSLEEINEVFEIRLMMEIHFAPAVIQAVQQNLTIQQLFEKNIQKNTEMALTFSTVEEYFKTYEIDKQFHELFIFSSGNKSALRIYKSLNTHAYAASLYRKQPKDKTIEGIQEHKQIYEAMRADDQATVLRLIRLHHENARDKIQLALKLHAITWS